MVRKTESQHRAVAGLLDLIGNVVNQFIGITQLFVSYPFDEQIGKKLSVKIQLFADKHRFDFIKAACFTCGFINPLCNLRIHFAKMDRREVNKKDRKRPVKLNDYRVSQILGS